MHRFTRLLALILLLSLSSLAYAAEWVVITSSTPAPPAVEVLSDNGSETLLKVTLPGYFEERIEIEGVTYLRISLPDSPHQLDAGYPELPVIVRDLAIADRGEVTVTVTDRETRSLSIPSYLPSRGSLPRNIDPDTVPLTFADLYTTDSYWPTECAQAEKPFILRNARGVSLRIYPFQVNPSRSTITLSVSMTLRVFTSGSAGENILTDDRRVPESLSFLDIYSNRFLNSAERGLHYTPLMGSGSLLIITNDTFYDEMLPLLHWKRQKGIPSDLVMLSDVGSTSSDVKSYIQTRYDSSGVTFIILVGDAQEMPYPTGTAGNVSGNAADPLYALLAGSDSYPDAIVSRLPAGTEEEASTMVNRLLNYEMTPQNGAAWYHAGTGIASAESGGTGSTDYQRMNWIRDDLLNFTYSQVDQIYDPGAYSSAVTAALNAGRSIVNYIGHGSDTSWGTTGYSVSNIYNLSNTDMVPFILDVACLNGHFNRTNGDCFAEAWLKAGTPAAPTGAIGIYASTTNQDWVPPCDAQAESIDRLVDGSFTTFGALCFNGVMLGLDNYPGATGNQLFQQWHIFGDGSTTVFTDTPAPLSTDHSGILFIGESTYSVTVSGEEGALCAIYDPATHTLLGSALTDGAGQAVITLDPAPAQVTLLTLTVTAFNALPTIEDVEVLIPQGPWLRYSAHGLDDSTGNGDGVLNPGESAILSLTLENIGPDAATGVSASLSTTSPLVTLDDDQALFEDVPPSGIGNSLADHFAFTPDPGTPAGTILPFTLDWYADGSTSGSTGFTVAVCDLLTLTNISISEISAHEALVTWTTSIPADSAVTWGSSTPPQNVETGPDFTTSHSVRLKGLQPCTTYYFSVSSSTPGCYNQTDDNSDAYYSFTTHQDSSLFFDDMENGPGNWIAGSPWALSEESAYSGTTAWSDSPGNSYGNYLNTSLVSPPVDLTGATSVSLTFYQTLSLSTGDYGYVEVSTNGSTWNILEQHSDTGELWTRHNYDLSSYAGSTALQVRFRLYSNHSGSDDGWHIDDVRIGPLDESCSPEASYFSHTLADQCGTGGSGDSDGLFDPGEEATLSIMLENTGALDLTGVWVELSTTHGGVTVIDDQANYPDIPVSGSRDSSAPDFQIRLLPVSSCGEVIPVDLTIHSDQGIFTDTFFQAVGGLLPPVTTPVIEEPFGAGIHASWIVVDGGSGGGSASTWTTANPGSRTANPPIAEPFAIADSGASGLQAFMDEELITPIVDATDAFAVTLSFDQVFSYNAGGGNESGVVEVRSSLTSGAWVNVLTNSGVSSPDPDHHDIDITAHAAGASDLEVRFRYYNAFRDLYWIIDNVTVTLETPGECAMTPCEAGSLPRPIPDGSSGTAPLTVSHDPANPNLLNLLWDDLCSPVQVDLLYGAIADVSSYGLSGALCDAGSHGIWDTSGMDSIWFILVSQDGNGEESSWGHNGSGIERNGSFASGYCGSTTKDTTGTCP